MRWELWLAFVGASFAISVSPGAGAVQSMATGLTHGLRRGWWSVAGLQIGLMAQLAVVAVGLGDAQGVAHGEGGEVLAGHLVAAAGGGAPVDLEGLLVLPSEDGGAA